MVEEADAIRRALEKYSTRERRRAAETAEREELFQRADAGRRGKAEMDAEGQVRLRGGHGEHVDGRAARSSPASPQKTQKGLGAATRDVCTQMASSVARSKRAIEEMFETGNSILTTMAGSRERLKVGRRRAILRCAGVLVAVRVLSPAERAGRARTFGRSLTQAAQRKAMDMLHSIGLGETLLKLIERRQRMDIWLTYGGMVRDGRAAACAARVLCAPKRSGAPDALGWCS